MVHAWQYDANIRAPSRIPTEALPPWLASSIHEQLERLARPTSASVPEVTAATGTLELPAAALPLLQAVGLADGELDVGLGLVLALLLALLLLAACALCRCCGCYLPCCASGNTPEDRRALLVDVESAGRRSSSSSVAASVPPIRSVKPPTFVVGLRMNIAEQNGAADSSSPVKLRIMTPRSLARLDAASPQAAHRTHRKADAAAQPTALAIDPSRPPTVPPMAAYRDMTPPSATSLGPVPPPNQAPSSLAAHRTHRKADAAAEPTALAINPSRPPTVPPMAAYRDMTPPSATSLGPVPPPNQAPSSLAAHRTHRKANAAAEPTALAINPSRPPIVPPMAAHRDTIPTGSPERSPGPPMPSLALPLHMLNAQRDGPSSAPGERLLPTPGHSTPFAKGHVESMTERFRARSRQYGMMGSQAPPSPLDSVSRLGVDSYIRRKKLIEEQLLDFPASAKFSA